MEKITNKSALNFVINTYADTLPSEVKEKLEAMVAALDKKSAGDRKPTATQVENARLAEIIYENIPAEGMTVTDAIKNIPELDGLNTQKVAPMFNALVKANRARKETIKGRAYFYKVEG